MSIHFPNINFDDINKFEASCGVFLLILDAASFILDNKEISIPLWLRITVAFIAFIAISRGLCQWRNRQNKIDEKLELDIEEKRSKLKDATEEQIKKKEKITDEKISEAIMLEQNKTQDAIMSDNSIELRKEETGATHEESAFNKYIQIKQEMFQQLSKINNQNYSIQYKQVLDNVFFYDFIYVSKRKKLNDIVIEIRYINELQLNRIGLFLNLESLEIQMHIYKRNVRENSNLALIIIYKNSEIDTETYRNKIIQLSMDKPVLREMKICFVKEQNISDFDANLLCV